MPSLIELCRILGDDLYPADDRPLPVREITGVHVSELPDPTVFLDGGELLLTAGMPIRDDEAQIRAYVQRLVARDIAGLTFGLGTIHNSVPAKLISECASVGLPLLVVPGPTPFQLISRTYWTLVGKAGHEQLKTALSAHRDLVGAAAGKSPATAVIRSLARSTGGWVAQLRPDGEVVEAWPKSQRAMLRTVRTEVSRLRNA